MSNPNKKKQKDVQLSSSHLSSRSPESQKELSSPHSLEEKLSKESLPPRWKFYVKVLLVLILVSGSGYYIYQRFSPDETFINENFSFPKYCPIAYDKSDRLLRGIKNIKRNFTSSEMRLLTSEGVKAEPKTRNTTYIVYVKVGNVTNPITKQTLTRLTYCSAVTPWNSTCDQAVKFICSSPGPMFYVLQNQPIDVVWVNDVEVADSRKLPPSNYHNQSNPSRPTVEIKSNAALNSSCNFLDPTQDLGNDYPLFQLNQDHVPVSTHIHGLEVRPTFDGNPTSWFLNNGTKGIGYLSEAINDPYYNNRNIFPSADNFSMFDFSEVKNVKINNYPNFQYAGNLWYHDHAMRATAYNVAQGLAGMYIIYNQKVEDFLDKYSEQRAILITDDFWNYTPNADMKASHPLGIEMRVDRSDFSRSKLYRLRVLNGNFRDSVTFQFAYSNSLHYLDRTSTDVVPLKFTVIGADSTLFDTFVSGVDEFILGPAERIEIVIDLSGIPTNVTTFQLNAFNIFGAGGPAANLPRTLSMNLTGLCCSCVGNNTNLKCPTPLPNQMPGCSNQTTTEGNCQTKYQNLTKKALDPTNNASAILQRYRVFDFTGQFGINGHTHFMHAQSEKPKIGTTEDWIFINFLEQAPHPVHVHLIQYQIQAKYQLRMFNQNCSFYQLDYYRQVDFGNDSNKRPYKSYNDSEFCNFLNNNVSGFNPNSYLPNENELLLKYHLENQLEEVTISKADLAINESKSKINVSGIYLYKVQEYTTDINYTQLNPACSGKYNQNRYICNDIEMPEWQRRWKETALTPGNQAVRVRIRWASADWTPEKRKNQYFRVNEEALAEYPGFVYHCHILGHEDNEMMRPIMMQFSDSYLQTHSKKNWQELLGNEECSTTGFSSKRKST